MKILVLSPDVPHAHALSGQGIVYRRMRYLLDQGHQLGLAAYYRQGTEPPPTELTPELCGMRLVPHHPPASFRPHVSSLGAYPPFPFNHYHVKAMQQAIGELVNAHHFDLVLAEFSVMGALLVGNPYLSAVRRVLSVHHCHSVMLEKEIRLRHYGPRVSLMRLIRRRVRRYEFTRYRQMDRVLTLTPEERVAMLRHGRDLHIEVIPSGVDTRYYQPAERHPSRPTLVFTGHFADDANRDAALWFLRSIWPQVTDQHGDLALLFVGPGVTEGLRHAAGGDARIHFTGEVPDVRPYLHAASVYICPVRLGSGMRHKLLEAMACGLPVVTTTLGAEGIAIRRGETGFVGDTPEWLAQWIRLLLEDHPLASSVAQAARKQVEEQYGWDIVGQQLERVLRETLTLR